MIRHFKKFGALCILLTTVSLLSGCSVAENCRDGFNNLKSLVTGLPNNCTDCNSKRAAIEDALYKLRKCLNDECERLGRHTCEQTPLSPEEKKQGAELCDKFKEIRAHCRSMGCDTSEWFIPTVCKEIDKLPATGAKEGLGAEVVQSLLGNESTTTKSSDGKVGWVAGGSATSVK